MAIKKNRKKIVVKNIGEVIDFTEEEKNLIKEYCDIKIKHYKKKPKIEEWYENVIIKERTKKIIDNSLVLSCLLFDELQAMVWNFEYLDKMHNKLNISILSKMENTKYYKNKCIEFEKLLKQRKSNIKVKGVHT